MTRSGYLPLDTKLGADIGLQVLNFPQQLRVVRFQLVDTGSLGLSTIDLDVALHLGLLM